MHTIRDLDDGTRLVWFDPPVDHALPNGETVTIWRAQWTPRAEAFPHRLWLTDTATVHHLTDYMAAGVPDVVLATAPDWADVPEHVRAAG